MLLSFLVMTHTHRLLNLSRSVMRDQARKFEFGSKVTVALRGGPTEFSFLLQQLAQMMTSDFSEKLRVLVAEYDRITAENRDILKLLHSETNKFSGFVPAEHCPSDTPFEESEICCGNSMRCQAPFDQRESAKLVQQPEVLTMSSPATDQGDEPGGNMRMSSVHDPAQAARLSFCDDYCVEEEMHEEFSDDGVTLHHARNSVARRRQLNTLLLLEVIPAVVIVLSAASMATSNDVEPQSQLWDILEVAFAVFFLGELMIKIWLLGFKEFFWGKAWMWGCYDAFCVCLSMWEMTMLVLGTRENGQDATSLLKILKLARLSRIVRLLRFKVFIELRHILQALYSGLRVLFWALICLFLIAFVVGLICRVLPLISDEPEFSSFPSALLTSYRIIMTGAWVAHDGAPLQERIRRSIRQADNSSPTAKFKDFCWIVSYIVFTCITQIGLQNLILSVFIDTVHERSTQRHQQELGMTKNKVEYAIGSRLQELCDRSTQRQLTDDELGAGETSKQLSQPSALLFVDDASSLTGTSRMKAANSRRTISQECFNYWLANDTSLNGVLDDADIDLSMKYTLFEVLDSDASGALSYKELLEGLMKCRGPVSKAEIVAIRLKVKFITQYLEKLLHKSKDQHSGSKPSSFHAQIKGLAAEYDRVHAENQDLRAKLLSKQQMPKEVSPHLPAKPNDELFAPPAEAVGDGARQEATLEDQMPTTVFQDAYKPFDFTARFVEMDARSTNGQLSQTQEGLDRCQVPDIDPQARHSSANDQESSIQSLLFLEVLPALVIIMSAVVMAISSDITEPSLMWELLEIVFAVFFFLELVIKVYLFGWREFFCGKSWFWGCYDAFCVGLSIIEVITFYASDRTGTGSAASQFLKVLKLARLSRIIRVLRFKIFHELKLMFQGLFAGLRVLIWAVGLLFVVTFTTSLIFLIFPYSGFPEFSNFADSFVTLFRAITEGQFVSYTGSPMEVLMRRSMQAWFPVVGDLTYIFQEFLLTCFIQIGLTNLIMAVFIDTVNDRSQKKNQFELGLSAERTEYELAAKLQELATGEAIEGRRPVSAISRRVSELNARAEGNWCASTGFASHTEAIKKKMASTTCNISRKRFNRWLAEDKSLTETLEEANVDLSMKYDLFDVLDADSSGELSYTELLEGLMRCRGPVSKADIVAIRLQVQHIARLVDLIDQTKHYSDCFHHGDQDSPLDEEPDDPLINEIW
eukprot:TRINITY_DN20050_c0_g1_i1.p1 TRINITY_DN20050_c0_g1~~TRINITY_DN20050_c0_g1_i1.p1  ORF type:complete len:1208 (+),score=169.27 TRINITY_DN20050_c0_g1_i1:32-3655(+)